MPELGKVLFTFSRRLALRSRLASHFSTTLPLPLAFLKPPPRLLLITTYPQGRHKAKLASSFSIDWFFLQLGELQRLGVNKKVVPMQSSCGTSWLADVSIRDSKPKAEASFLLVSLTPHLTSHLQITSNNYHQNLHTA